MNERREWWIRETDSVADLAYNDKRIVDDYIEAEVRTTHVREVLPGDYVPPDYPQFRITKDELNRLYRIEKQHAKLADLARDVVESYSEGEDEHEWMTVDIDGDAVDALRDFLENENE